MNKLQKPTRPRVVIADDHEHARIMTARLLSETHDIVGSAVNGQELLDITRDIQSDLVIVDVDMPVLSGLQALPLLVKQCPDSKIIVVTVTEDADLARHALALGANAFVIKSRLAKDLFSALVEVAAARNFVSPFRMESHN